MSFTLLINIPAIDLIKGSITSESTYSSPAISSALSTLSYLTNALAILIEPLKLVSKVVNSFALTTAFLYLPESIFSYRVFNSLDVYLENTPLIHSISLVKNDLISVFVLLLSGFILNASNSSAIYSSANSFSNSRLVMSWYCLAEFLNFSNSVLYLEPYLTFSSDLAIPLYLFIWSCVRTVLKIAWKASWYLYGLNALV